MFRRLTVVGLLLAATAAFAEPPRTPGHRKWKCRWIGRVVVCDLVDRPLSLAQRPEGSIVLRDRAEPDFTPLVTPPAAFDARAPR